MNRYLATLLASSLVLGFSTLGGAQTPQNTVSPTAGTMTNQTVPMNNSTVPMNNLPANTNGAPTGNSTLGPAGRPNMELAPSTTGTINSMTSSTISGDATGINRNLQRSSNGTINPNLPPNTTSPLPSNTK